MQVRLIGVHRVRKLLADGSIRVYHYAWRGGPRIEAEPGTREFMAEYTRLTMAKPKQEASLNMAALIHLYRRSAAFQNLSAKTREDYERHLTLIHDEYFDLPLAAVEQRGARAMFVDWRDERADTPRSADLTFAVLRRLLSYAADRELILRNPILNVAPLSSGSRADIIWTDEQIAKMKAKASEPIRRALILALWTGQRQSDLLKLTWKAYDGTHLKLRQKKRGAFIRVKVSRELKEVLDAAPRGDAVQILTNSRGQPWTQDGFKSSWAREREAAGISGVTFHDLRGTFITLAYRNGATIREIAEVSGHSEKDAEAIIRKHYLAGDAAVERIESRTENVNHAANCKPGEAEQPLSN